MKQDETLERVYKHLGVRCLGKAITEMENYLALHPHQLNYDRLFAIKTDYQLMCDYWRNGFKDPQLPELYQRLLHRMYVLYANMSTNYRVLHSPFLASLFMKAYQSSRDWSVQVVKEQLESFVSDKAMLDLEPPHTVQERRKTLYQQHHKMMADLFARILTADLWTEGQGEVVEQLLLAPTVDSIDQQLIVSAITMAALNCFDMVKFRTLIHVYQLSTDEQVRQRALVGWVLSIDDTLFRDVYPEMGTIVNQVLENPECRKELAELQKQVYFCMSAVEDNIKIQTEIMPDLIKGQGYNVTRDGIIEKEEDTLNNILHPDEEERKLEQVEASFNRMIDMQKQGSDIYFGGFSQMKRFPFFSELANWFMPFYEEHPDIEKASGTIRDNAIMKGMLKYGPFCNSDKYSFALAFENVLNKIPKDMLDMLKRGEAEMFEKVAPEELSSPTYIRRMYLQDLFRFFRLHPFRAEFRNFFTYERHKCLFFSYELFMRSPLQEQFNEIITFLIKRKRKQDAWKVLRQYTDNRYFNYDYYMLSAYLNDDPETNYMRALELKPKNERALTGLAREWFKDGHYGNALGAYDQLLEINPEKKSYLLNKAVCLTNLHRYEEAEQILFRLNYEDADDLNVSRVLAWALTGDGKYEQAGNLYEQLMAVETPAEGDVLNYGFFLWFTGRINEAVRCFKGIEDNFSLIEEEKELLELKGITDEEIRMMHDLVDA